MQSRRFSIVVLVLSLSIHALAFSLVSESQDSPAARQSFPLVTTPTSVDSDPGNSDTLRFSAVNVIPGAKFSMRARFYCDEELGAMQIVLRFDTAKLVCDSVSFVNSTLLQSASIVSIDSAEGIINTGVIYAFQQVIPPQNGIFGDIHFSQKGSFFGETLWVDTFTIVHDSLSFSQTIFSQSNPAVSIFPEFVNAPIAVADFLPGDANNDVKVNIADVTFLIARIFANGPAPPIPAAADCNASCTINIGDVTYLISRIFSSGPAPVPGCAT